VQAAQHFAAEHVPHGRNPELVEAQGFPPLGVERVGDSSWRVALRGRDGTAFEVTVHRDPGPAAVLLTCHADAARHPPVFRLQDLRARDG
jgi:hypothetical protein